MQIGENFQLHDRLSAAELRLMAMRQQQQIDTQQQMLAAKEQRLRFLKTQESRAAVTVAETERLHRLRERVEAQESKLRRLRALRGQVDLQKTYNVTLGNDLDSIRALFSEKEKELTLAVAKVEALTRQLEDLRRNRRGGIGSHGFIGQNTSNGVLSPAAKELEKLRLELQYRNQLSLQQNARLNMQREVLQQRQIELHSVDKRIVELQSRIHKKRNLNVQNYKVQASKDDSSDHQNNNPSAAISNVTLHMRSASTNAISSNIRSLSRGNIVTNPSAANDEGITALHNAICAGHFEIVKFLVNFGCDVNAQDSDGWTPLHCAASCNNLPMVKFLVESGACLFAATLSDHETPAEKCEEDEEGFDGCSEYLYSIQEKLGILNNGEVYAVFAYESQQSDELSFYVNDKLTILRKGDETEREWWWARDITTKEGYVPRNLLGLHPRLTQ
ncbi:hypothetical protein AND_005276 [Anopheles darlingi]|uniref:SH3 domain-containing protein n=1 Tax=Anopheles darlingi TaxID=43151 RepID=W5JF76_ANODA|nr:hypothetical protein AND_005276 [Anopheles darlingi]